MNTKITYTAVELKILRHEYRVPIDEMPLFFSPSILPYVSPHYLYPDPFPPGSRIIRLKPGQRLPRGSIPLPFPIEERNRSRHFRNTESPLPGEANYEYKYTSFFEKYMKKEPESREGIEHGTGESFSESSSDSVQFQLPPQ